MIITSEERLRVECADVLPDEIGHIRDALENELRRANQISSKGIGLAAPQIGIPKRMAIVRLGKTANYTLDIDLVNCKIASGYDEAIFEQEGCLSFPGRWERTKRFQEIHVVENIVGPVSFIATGLFAVACQHELDHLVGRLLPDVALPKQEYFMKPKKIGPNDVCYCGKLDPITRKPKKYKKCCGSLI